MNYCARCGHASEAHPRGLDRFLFYCQGANPDEAMCRCKSFVRAVTTGDTAI